MLHQNAFLACGAAISSEVMVLILACLAALGISAILALINILLIFGIHGHGLATAGHAVAWLGYVAAGAFLFTGMIRSPGLLAVVIFGVALATLGHFLQLLRTNRKCRSSFQGGRDSSSRIDAETVKLPGG